eukprot:gnl/MRDRNA2_/MRDRNA2_80610_c0_seq3.p2 gnl/MRDRNA2_/MRDRNA2_80610_c0~~gnl/MRDRNA2_/MRDRNA2_80610_c0_seq3.p2  ORF type:complete len:100 (+),score=23.19 gnl/MRDRNA2_/MRDRNA2_80610_c0_seq3:1-300(+)
MARERLTSRYVPDEEKKQKAIEFRETRSKELLAFADEAIAAGQLQMASEAAGRAVHYVNALPAGSCESIDAKIKEIYSQLGRPMPSLHRSSAPGLCAQQ